MFIYWVLFLVFATGALLSMPQALMTTRSPAFGGPSGIGASPAVPVHASSRALFLATLFPVFLIGFRYRVGTDYPTYLATFERINHLSLTRSLGVADVGYAALNWAVAQVGGGFWMVNLVCGVLFTYGLIKFAKIQPNPWLAVTIAIPYLVIT